MIRTTTVRVYPGAITSYITLTGWQCAGQLVRAPAAGFPSALVLARLAGALPLTAANVGLVTALLLLVYHGWSAGRAANLRGGPLLAATSVAAALGVAMVVLKDVVLLHLH